MFIVNKQKLKKSQIVKKKLIFEEFFWLASVSHRVPMGSLENVRQFDPTVCPAKSNIYIYFLFVLLGCHNR